MDYRRVDPDMGKLRTVALEVRPDIKSKRATLSQRESDLKLAKAFRIPDVTIGAGYAVQGPRGPDNQQMGILNLGVPLPLFNRNQGGIVQAEVGLQSAQADLYRTGIRLRTKSMWPTAICSEPPTGGGLLGGVLPMPAQHLRL